ncbi:MAG: hypothetical protein ACOYNP_09330, partial [Gemmataceae bacterium]
MTAPRRADKRLSLQVINAETARYECTYGRGCEGVCCQQGRPPVDQEQRARIEKLKRRWMPLLRPEARALIERNDPLPDGTRLLPIFMPLKGRGGVASLDGLVSQALRLPNVAD